MDEFQAARMHISYVYPQLFVTAYLRQNGYDINDFAPHHIQILNALKPCVRGQQINIQSPRGSAKSTLAVIFLPLWRVCYAEWDEMLGEQPDTFILITRRSEKMAKQSLADIAYLLQNNDDIIDDFGELRGEKWLQTHIQTNTGIDIQCNGRGQSPRGSLIRDKRLTLALNDDLQDPEELLNPDNREKDETWLFTDWMAAGDMGGKITNYMFIDTNKHPSSISEKLRKTAGWSTLRFQAIRHPQDLYHPTNEHLWKEWESYYADMSIDDDEREAKAQQFYDANQSDMVAGVSELWPQELSYLSIRKWMVSRGYFYVMREYQNIADDPSMALFDMDNAITFKLAPEGILRSDKRLVQWTELAGITTFLDTAGTQETIDGTFAAAVSVAWQPLAGGADQTDSLAGINGYVLAGGLIRGGITDQIRMAIELHQRAQQFVARAFPESKFCIEQRPDPDGSIRYSTDHAFRAEAQALNFNVPLTYHSQNQNKLERIKNLQPYIKNGWLAFHEIEIPAEAWTQMRQFPSADYIDFPDALEGACRSRIYETKDVRNADKARRDYHRRNPRRVSL